MPLNLAEVRAETLLRSYLSPLQLLEWDAKKRFNVIDFDNKMSFVIGLPSLHSYRPNLRWNLYRKEGIVFCYQLNCFVNASISPWGKEKCVKTRSWQNYSIYKLTQKAFSDSAVDLRTADGTSE